MKKFVSILAAVCILLTAVPMSVISFAEEGKFDELNDVTWYYDAETKSLTFEGSGMIPDYTVLSDRPWHEFEIESITVGGGILAIGTNAFCSLESLKSVTLMNGVSLISNEAFYLCTSLETVALPDSLQVIGKAAFDQCTSLTEITFPATLESIGERAFYCCENMETISPIPATKLGANIFDGCEKLTKIEFAEGVTAIPEAICSGCTALNEVVLPKSVRSIGADAFNLCLNLKSITIPAAVSTIGEKAFGYGKKGAKIDDFEISAYTDTAAAAYAIANSFNLIDLGYTDYGSCGDDAAWSYDTETKTLTIDGTGTTYDYTPDKLPTFSRYEIEKIAISKEITSIGAYMFCESDITGLLDLSACDALTAIGEKAFYGCDWITFVKVGQNLADIGEKAFAYTPADGTDDTLYVILVGAKDSALQKYAEDNSLDFMTYSEFPGFEGKCGDTAKWIYDADTCALKITGTGAMNNCTETTGFFPYTDYLIFSLEIDDGITHLGDYAFLDCYIDSAVVPDSVESIGEYALGYYLYFNEDDGLYYAVLNPDFVIVCSPLNECAIRYAEENDFTVEFTDTYVFNSDKPMLVDEENKKIILYTQDANIDSFTEEYFSYLADGVTVEMPDAIATGAKLTIHSGDETSEFTIIVVGDANGDGMANSIDALMCLYHSVGTATLDGAKYEAANINGDGGINSIDALAILNVSVGNTTLDKFMPQQ